MKTRLAALFGTITSCVGLTDVFDGGGPQPAILSEVFVEVYTLN